MIGDVLEQHNQNETVLLSVILSAQPKDGTLRSVLGLRIVFVQLGRKIFQHHFFNLQPKQMGYFFF